MMEAFNTKEKLNQVYVRENLYTDSSKQKYYLREKQLDDFPGCFSSLHLTGEKKHEPQICSNPWLRSWT